MRLVVVLLAGCSYEHGLLVDAAPGMVGSTLDVPAGCPDSYALTLPGSSSRYRVISTAAAFAAQHAACNADRAHLASPETATEITALRSSIAASGVSGQYYIGAVQRPNQPATDVGWFVFTGEPLPAGLWGNSNDDNPGENNEENLAALNTIDLLHDVTGDLPYPAICECDGRATDPTVATYIP